MRYLVGLIILLMLSAGSGCSAGSDLTASPVENARDVESSMDAHMLWGMWQFSIDPIAGSIDVSPLRGCSMHLQKFCTLRTKKTSFDGFLHLKKLRLPFQED